MIRLEKLCQSDELPPVEERIPCGLVSIDALMRGGLSRGRAGVVCGFTGVGKSSLAINMAVGAARLGYHSRVATLEMPLKEMEGRLVSCVAHIPYDWIVNGRPGRSREQLNAEAKEVVEQRASQFRENFGFYDYCGKDCTIPLLAEAIRRDRDKGTPPAMLCVDYLGLLKLPADGSAVAQDRPMELRHQLEKVAGDFAQLCERENIAGWMFEQSDFTVEDRSVVKMSNSSEAKGVSRHFSCFLGFGGTADELERHNIVTITADKMRNGKRFSTQIKRVLSHQRFEDLPWNERLRLAGAYD